MSLFRFLSFAATFAFAATGFSATHAQGLFDRGGALSIDKPFDRGGSLSIDKPLDKGGSLSIDKPLDKGGGLSIDKPFDRGGALSINKVYVPPKLRIGRVHSVWEVIIPVCWGSPQDCRGMEPDKAQQHAGNVSQPGHPYYITARYICKDRRTGALNGRQCDVTQASSRSCNEALAETQSYPSTHGDPCTVCANIRDQTSYWDGTAPEHIQGGACWGW